MARRKKVGKQAEDMPATRLDPETPAETPAQPATVLSNVAFAETGPMGETVRTAILTQVREDVRRTKSVRAERRTLKTVMIATCDGNECS
jgi:hypothetical protein